MFKVIFNESEVIISAKHSCAMLKFDSDVGSTNFTNLTSPQGIQFLVD